MKDTTATIRVKRVRISIPGVPTWAAQLPRLYPMVTASGFEGLSEARQN